MRSSTPWLNRLRELPRFGSGPGLHRMAWLSESLTARAEAAGERLSPLPPAVRITGSRGKGTVAHLTGAVLRGLGLSVGLYTSPHFLHFEERFRIDGVPASGDELEVCASRVLAAIEEYRGKHPADEFAHFEAVTAMALALFRRRSPDVLVTEAGIGGRFDSTQVFPGEVTALTSLELEHTEVLGTELLTIAHDKADLCPDGGVLVLGEIEPEIRRRLTGALALRGVRGVSVDEALAWEIREIGPERMRIDVESRRDGPPLKLEDLELGLVGRHQARNAALAVQLVREWLARRGEAPPLDEAIREGWADVDLAGRFQRLAPGSGTPEVFIDVAHTPASVRSLAQTVEAALGDRPLVLVVGVSQGRDPALLAPLIRRAAAVICTASRYRGQRAARLLRPVRREASGRPVEAREGIEDALERARALARSIARSPARPGRLEPAVLVTGSYFLAAEAAALAAGLDPRELGFEPGSEPGSGGAAEPRQPKVSR